MVRAPLPAQQLQQQPQGARRLSPDERALARLVLTAGRELDPADRAVAWHAATARAPLAWRAKIRLAAVARCHLQGASP